MTPDPLDTVEPPAPGERAAPNLQDYLRILLRFKWGVLALMLAGGFISVLHAYSETPLYEATATMLIERQAARFVSIEEVYRGNQGYFDMGEYYQTQYEILRSRPIAERLVDKLGLATFAAKPKAANGFSLSKLLPQRVSVTPPPPPAEQRAAAINRVLGSVSVVPVRNSQLVRIQYRGPDPELAAKLANSHAQAYIEETLKVACK